MLSCSGNHLCVCHQCISGITGLFVCAILSSISVPARRTHSHLHSSSTRSYTVYCCTTVSLSGLFLQDHTDSVFFLPFHSVVLSMVPDLCIDYLNIPISGEKCSGIGKWIFLITTINHSLWWFKSSTLLCDHSAKMPRTVTFPNIHCDSCCVQSGVVSHTRATPISTVVDNPGFA